MQTNWIIIANPTAGGGKGKQQATALSSLLSTRAINHQVFFTEAPKQLTEIAHQQIKEGHQYFIVVGGDGSLHEWINAALNQSIISPKALHVGFLPSGTGNDFARTLNLGNYPEYLLPLIEKGQYRYLDAGKATVTQQQKVISQYYANVAGMGFDAFVAENYLSKNKSMGQVSYLFSLLQGLFAYRNQEVSVQVNDEVIKSKIFVLAAGIGKYFGGGMKICPNASPDNALLDITLVQNMSKLAIVRELSNIYSGNFIKNKQIRTLRTTQITIDAPKPVYIQLDGELVGHTPASFSVLPQYWRILAP
ncbi:MAG: diacylglycerol kinase family lipid kinase [Chitinophagales bacterium]|nr:diacylglycerol kinase family lipid kinase [Bacteroidota bacterium]MCB9043690.1 diacylglycerol kinase family lipid kinase [Chitinophagales bacterium]